MKVALQAGAQILLWLFPWVIRRRVLNSVFGFALHKTSKVGFSLILARQCSIGAQGRVGSGTIIKGLDLLEVGDGGRIGNFNWITALPRNRANGYFLEQVGRKPVLVLGGYSSITAGHLIDCTDAVSIGPFSVVGGWRSQFLTHSLEIIDGRQSCAPIRIGHHCFIGTGVILLKGSLLPARSVLAAGSVLTGRNDAECILYAGNPARPVKALERSSAYLNRDANHDDR
ncbi:acyltransferase [Sphingomonas sp. GCM10030256]|uniref:acyltransferase n=1 Tax=Sphingomonas sp. GCM10030256 TaxID=3273427 RepID=UPI0036158813